MSFRRFIFYLFALMVLLVYLFVSAPPPLPEKAETDASISIE